MFLLVKAVWQNISNLGYIVSLALLSIYTRVSLSQSVSIHCPAMCTKISCFWLSGNSPGPWVKIKTVQHVNLFEILVNFTWPRGGLGRPLLYVYGSVTANLCFEGFLWIVVFHFLPKILALYIVLKENKHSQGHLHETKQEINSRVSKFFISIFFSFGGWMGKQYFSWHSQILPWIDPLQDCFTLSLCCKIHSFSNKCFKKIANCWLLPDFKRAYIATAKTKD